MSKPNRLEDITPGDVNDILKSLKKDGEGAYEASKELADMWWSLALAGVHNPPAKEDLGSLILDLLLDPPAKDDTEQEVGDKATKWWCLNMTGAFNPVQDIAAKDSLALLLVSATKKAGTL